MQSWRDGFHCLRLFGMWPASRRPGTVAAAFIAGLIAGFLGPAQAASLSGLAVEVINQSEPVLCAEKDNVAIALRSPEMRSFRVEAGHPAYIGTLQRDSFEPDWTACDMSADPSFKAPTPPRRVTIYEEHDFWLVGHTQASFWRPATATVRVGNRVEKGIHLLQLWMLRPMGGEEVLVLYPQDGYWRIRPMAPKGMALTAFGSSFLVGPIEEEGRPIVRIKEVVFDPQRKRFTLTFERGGSAHVDVVKSDDQITALDVGFDKPIAGRPFAMLRSMYITEFNNDVARIAVREKAAKGWREDGIMSFGKATATDVWTGRIAPSRHNTSSPDMVFSRFSDAMGPVRSK